jgi:hypothetical protein
MSIFLAAGALHGNKPRFLNLASKSLKNRLEKKELREASRTHAANGAEMSQ